MEYTKATTRSEEVLEAGYPLLVYYEIDGENVLRYVEVYRDGRTLRESIERLKGVVFGSLVEGAPKPEFNWDGAPAFVESSSQEEFEQMWAKGAFLGD